MKKAYGFSLIELTVSFSIILILLTIALSRFNFLGEPHLACEQDLLRATLSYVQYKAVVTNKPYVISFDPVNNSYTYHQNKKKLVTYTLKHGVRFGFLPGAKGPPLKPKHIIQQAITFDKNQVTSSPDGVMSAGSVYMLDKHGITMVALTCGITEVTAIKKYRYEQNQWIAL